MQQTQRLSLNASLATAIHILRTDAAGLSRYLEEQASNNPQLILAPQSPGEWLPRWRDVFTRSGGSAEMPEAEAAAPSLVAHVMDAVAAMRLGSREARIVEVFIEVLEPSGWLGKSVAACAALAGAPVAEAEAVLTKLQRRIEPTGLFARSLGDCLRLQAEDAEVLDAAMAKVLARLDLLADGDFARLAREIGLSEAEVRQKIMVIRGFDPKPGAQFEACAAPIREPDLMARKGDAGWEISLNRSALPSMALADRKADQTGSRSEARALIRLVEGRNATLLTIAREILMRQAAALDDGIGAVVPMTMAEIAEAVGFHQSTVSRVVAGAAVDTPKGTWWLRALFSQALTEDGLSAAALRARLQRLVAAEDSAKPLSDAALSASLSADGAPVARRTVAKYREMLGLPPAHRRRKALVVTRR